MMRKVYFIAAVVFGLMCQKSFAQSVVVNQYGGVPIENALVLDGNGKIVAVSDSVGKFVLPSVGAATYYVWHSSYMPTELQMQNDEPQTVRLTPYVNDVKVADKAGGDAAFVKLRGWLRNLQFNDGSLNFMSDGIVEYFVPLKKSGKTKVRTEGWKHYMVEDQRREYDSSEGQKLYATVALASSQGAIVSKDGMNVLREARVSSDVKGTQQDIPELNVSVVNLPDVLNDDHTYKFFKVKMRCAYQNLVQTLSPYRTDGAYSMADLQMLHSLQSFDTSIAKKQEQLYVIRDFYVSEAELLTADEAKRQWKQRDSDASVAAPAHVPPLCKALQTAKERMVVATK